MIIYLKVSRLITSFPNFLPCTNFLPKFSTTLYKPSKSTPYIYINSQLHAVAKE